MPTCDACGREFMGLVQWGRFWVCHWCKEMAEIMEKVTSQNCYEGACECHKGNS
jgi:hypothetical protein